MISYDHIIWPLTSIDTGITLTKHLLRSTSRPRVIIEHIIIEVEELVIKINIPDAAGEVGVLDLEVARKLRDAADLERTC